MKVLLRDTRTRFYCQGPKEWVSESKRATDFGNIETAAEFWLEHRLRDAEVVLSYEDPPCQITLPVSEDWFESSARCE